jgi:DNA topoisomerase-3
MQNPSLHCQGATDTERRILREKGIGTPATRSGIIQTLISRGYCVREKNKLAATEKAIALIQNLKPEDLVSPLVTANWEQKLLEIEKGSYSAKTFSIELEDFVNRIIKQAYSSCSALKKSLTELKEKSIS